MKRDLFIIMFQILFFLYFTSSVAADDIFHGFTKQEKSAEQSFIENGDFNRGAEKWNLPSGFRWEGSGGRNGGGGLFYERSDISHYQLAFQFISLQPGTRYRFGAWMKTAGTKGSAHIAIQFFDENKVFRGGKFINGTTASSADWQHIEDVFVTPDKPMLYQVALYLSKGDTGEVWFDDIVLKSTEASWAVNMMYPTHESLPVAGGDAWFGVFESPAPIAPRDGLVFRYDLSADGKTHQMGYHNILSNRVCVTIKPIPAGVYDLAIAVADTNQRVILKEKKIAFTVKAPVKTPANACVIDTRGRAMVGGAPFLPIGLYLGGVRREDIDTISKSPFNCIMPYSSMALRFTDSQLQNQPSAGMEVLDELHKNRIKIIYSIKDVYDGTRWAKTAFAEVNGEKQVIEKVVTTFREHPALLAWYINDELPMTMVPRITERRREVNLLDPYHPTWSVLYQIDDLPEYGETSDILGIDNYPIRKKSDRHMQGYYRGIQVIEKMSRPNGVSSWVVPQAYNDGLYSCKDIDCMRNEHRDPTEEEMRSMALLFTAGGAKGFIFYSYFDLFKPLVLPQSEQRWKELCRVGTMLSELAPFILSDSDGPMVYITMEQGLAIAKGFTDKKSRARIVIAGIGPGKTRAIIKVAGGGFRSHYGRCISRESDSYIFEGDDMCSDILVRGE